MKLKNKVALVTGAGIGIGGAIALELSREGADVAVNYLKSEKGAFDVVSKIKENGGNAVAIQADVTDEAQVKSMVEETVDRLGGLDILVNNAGVIERTTLEDLDVEEWDRVMNVNLRGPFLCTLYAGKHMIEQGGGNIVNISSIAALNPDIYMGAYSVSKAALNMFTEVAAVEWAEYNIRVNAVCPGPVETDMIRKAFNTPELLEARLNAIPNHRMSQPEDIAKVVSFLASDESSNITGEHIVVDGASSRSMYFLINQLSK
jgi:NAD(P)-dependent dehydrogenase (short-subunit alcohol dehydrogenase family)